MTPSLKTEMIAEARQTFCDCSNFGAELADVNQHSNLCFIKTPLWQNVLTAMDKAFTAGRAEGAKEVKITLLRCPKGHVVQCKTCPNIKKYATDPDFKRKHRERNRRNYLARKERGLSL